jgi:3-oxoadipate enol-lactonase/4-carboxymuconolactone decarboxylase
MSVPELAAVQLAGSPGTRRPLLVLGPSLGTSATSLWSSSAQLLSEDFDILAWDLPGHGLSVPAHAPFTVSELAEAVIALVDSTRGEHGATFVYAGDSLGGAVGLQLLLDYPTRVSAATLLCTGARIGTPLGWSDRAEVVRGQGTSVLIEASTARWFAAGFIDRQPGAAAAALDALKASDGASYAWACEALGAFDLRQRLGEITAPVLAVAGAKDEVTPVAELAAIADGVVQGRLVVLDEVAHLAPLEDPAAVAELIANHPAPRTIDQVRASGMAVRRAVLGAAHVDRATAAATAFTGDFQDFITQYAWGSIWTRPGLSRRSRSMITITALIAGGHDDELAMHIRAARTNGLTNDEIKEVLLQTAIYCGVPAANSAFRIANAVLSEMDEETGH